MESVIVKTVALLGKYLLKGMTCTFFIMLNHVFRNLGEQIFCSTVINYKPFTNINQDYLSCKMINGIVLWQRLQN